MKVLDKPSERWSVQAVGANDDRWFGSEDAFPTEAAALDHAGVILQTIFLPKRVRLLRQHDPDEKGYRHCDFCVYDFVAPDKLVFKERNTGWSRDDVAREETAKHLAVIMLIIILSLFAIFTILGIK